MIVSFREKGIQKGCSLSLNNSVMNKVSKLQLHLLFHLNCPGGNFVCQKLPKFCDVPKFPKMASEHSLGGRFVITNHCLGNTVIRLSLYLFYSAVA